MRSARRTDNGPDAGTSAMATMIASNQSKGPTRIVAGKRTGGP